MMAPDELQELAADIKENGLREPLVLADIPIFDEDGEPAGKELQLIDGRNRREACKIAEVEPATRVHAFDVKPDKEWPKAKAKRLLAEAIVDKAAAFTISANNMRRHMSNDARLLCAAFARPEAPTRPGRGKVLAYAKTFGLTGMNDQSAGVRMSRARLIVLWAPIDGRMVINGTKLFSEAFAEANRKKREFEDAEKAEAEKEKIKEERDARLMELRLRHPDLAKQVDDGESTIDETETLKCRVAQDILSRREKRARIGNERGGMAIEAKSGRRDHRRRVDGRRSTADAFPPAAQPEHGRADPAL